MIRRARYRSMVLLVFTPSIPQSFRLKHPCDYIYVNGYHLPPPLALLPGGEAAGVRVAIHGQLRAVTPQHIRLGASPTHSQILL